MTRIALILARMVGLGDLLLARMSVEALERKLDACARAALGEVDVAQVLSPGEDDWSVAYEDVVRVRRRHDALMLISCARQGHNGAVELAEAPCDLVIPSDQGPLTVRSRRGALEVADHEGRVLWSSDEDDRTPVGLHIRNRR